MSDDTRRILDLLAQGKISVDDADQLLRALDAQASEPAAPQTGAERRAGAWRSIPGAGMSRPPSSAESPGARFLRIEVQRLASERHREKHLNIRVPVAIVRGGMRLAAIFPGYAGDEITRRLRDRGIDLDLSKLDQAQLESLLTNLGEMTVDVDKGQTQVRITCE